MSDFELEWNGDGAADHVRSTVAQRLHRAAIAVKNRAKELLSVPGSHDAEDGRAVAFFKRKRIKGVGRVMVAHYRSTPGEPPRKQTGRLRDSVAHEVDASILTARVGTNVEYGKHLELGTKRGLKPRPWLRRALAETADRVLQLLAGG